MSKIQENEHTPVLVNPYGNSILIFVADFN